MTPDIFGVKQSKTVKQVLFQGCRFTVLYRVLHRFAIDFTVCHQTMAVK
jgi:hypothetical protein